MIRTTQLEIHGAEVEVRYFIACTVVAWSEVVVDGHTYRADWLILIASVREALEAHHANLLIEDNTDEEG